jgi:hypothetical protein
LEPRFDVKEDVNMACAPQSSLKSPFRNPFQRMPPWNGRRTREADKRWFEARFCVLIWSKQKLVASPSDKRISTGEARPRSRRPSHSDPGGSAWRSST